MLETELSRPWRVSLSGSCESTLLKGKVLTRLRCSRCPKKGTKSRGEALATPTERTRTALQSWVILNGEQVMDASYFFILRFRAVPPQCQLSTVQKDFPLRWRIEHEAGVRCQSKGYVRHQRYQHGSMTKHSCYKSVSILDNKPWIFGGTLSVTPINSTFICQTHLVKKWFWWQGLHIFQQNLLKSSNICLMRKEFRFPQLYELYCPNLDNDQSVNLTAAFTVFWQLCGLTFECHFLAFKFQLWVDFWPLVLVNDCFPVIGRCVKVAAGLEYLCQKGADVNKGQRSSSLHYAACFGRPQIAKVLLRFGANHDLRDEDGMIK